MDCAAPVPWALSFLPAAVHAARARRPLGVSAKIWRTVSLHWRTLAKPAANTTSATGRSVVSNKRRAVWLRWAARDSERPGPDLCGDEAVELARAVAEAPGHALDTVAVHDAVADQPHRPRHHVGPDVPLGGPRRGVGPATQAGAEAGLLSSSGGRVEADVLSLGRAGGAARPAIDPGRGHGAEEPPVEAGVLALGRLVAALRVLDHGCQRGTPL